MLKVALKSGKIVDVEPTFDMDQCTGTSVYYKGNEVEFEDLSKEDQELIHEAIEKDLTSELDFDNLDD